MAKVYTTEMTKVQNGDKASGHYNNARVRCITGTYTFSSTASGDQLVIGRLTKGDVVTGGDLYNAALGASTTLTLKALLDDGTTVTLSSAISTASAGTTNLMNSNLPKEMTDGGELVLEVGGAAATGAIGFNVQYAHG